MLAANRIGDEMRSTQEYDDRDAETDANGGARSVDLPDA